MKRTAATLALLFGSLSAMAQTPAPFLEQSLGHDAWAAIDNPAAKEKGAGSNAGFVIGAKGVAVIDTFESPDAAKQLLESIRAKTKLPVRFVINTHYHLDHVGGNNIFSAVGAVTMAQDNVRTWERTENAKFFGPKITPEQQALVTSLGLPDVTYPSGATIYLGDNRRLILRVMPGHTGGDTVVYDAEANVIFCGDLFWNHTLPNLIDASTKPWTETLDTLLADYPGATFVPGHGDQPGHAADVRAFRDYLLFLRRVTAEAQAKGATGDDVVKTVLPQLRAEYGSWGFFDFAEPNILDMDKDLRGTKRNPVPVS
jgi:glyoxylase-like metal-dependent hydrolase (beta-lactamase superfamily II)